MKHLRTLVTVALGLTALASCGSKERQGATVDVTLGLPAMTRPADWSAARADLGKKLFFDTRLSSNAKLSCSTCHLPEKAWTDGKQFSQKVDGSMNTRNSPSLYNVGYQPYFYWDGRAPTMEKNVAAAWKGHMVGDDEKLAQVVATVKGVEAYAKEFQSIYGGDATVDHIVDALCSFVRTLQSGGTRFDRFVKGDAAALDSDEKAGYALFTGKAGCVACHTPPMFTEFLFHNVGIGMDKETPDPGRKKVDENAALGSFKTPSLRGVALTAPYFHDGSVATLEEAVRIMAGGGKKNEHLDPILQTFSSHPLDDGEIAKLVAFLKALTPEQTVVAPKLP